MVFIFLGALITFSYEFTTLFKYKYKIIDYKPFTHQTCQIYINKPTIILRLDDVQSHAYIKEVYFIVDETLKRNMSVTLGVIPNNLEKDIKLLDFLKVKRLNNNIEIAVHGYNHNKSDIKITKELIIKGNEKIQRYLGVRPITYIPPYNILDDNSFNLISDYYDIIADEEDVLKEGNNSARIGFNVETYDYNNTKKVTSLSIVNKCKLSLMKTNICVVAIHPQEFNGVIYPKEYIKVILNDLNKLDVEFKTFKDIVYCE